MKQRLIDFALIIAIITVGVLVRLPWGHFSSIDTTQFTDPDSFFYARKAIELYDEPISNWQLHALRSNDPLMRTVDLEHDVSTTNLLPIMVALVCKVFPFLPIKDVTYFFCAFFCPLSAVPVYLFVKRYFNRIGAIVAALATSLSFSHFAHSMFGYFDTDSIIMLVALLLMLCCIDSIVERNKIKQIVFCIVEMALLLLFSIIWEPYYVYVIVICFLNVVALFYKIVKKVNLNSIFPLITTIIVFLLSLKTIIKKIGNLFFNSVWPNKDAFVGELKRPDFIAGGANFSFSCTRNGLVNWLGGLPLFVISVGSFIILLTFLFSKKKVRSVDQDNYEMIILLLISWMLIVSPFLIMGIRFIQLIALPINIMIGVTYAIYGKDLAKREISIEVSRLFYLLFVIFIFGAVSRANIIAAIIISVTLVLLGTFVKCSSKSIIILITISAFLCPIISEVKASENNLPFLSPDKIELSNYINSNVYKNAEFICWWNDGYAYQYMLNRRVLSDGGTYSGSFYYWLANFLMNDNEELSIGINNMLSLGGVEAVKIATELVGNEENADILLKEILKIDRNDAEELLHNKYSLDDMQTEELLKYTHPLEKINSYLILSSDDVAIIDAIAYYGFWDLGAQSSPSFDITLNEDGTYNIPDELENSLMIRLYKKENVDGFDLVYSNDTALLYKIGS